MICHLEIEGVERFFYRINNWKRIKGTMYDVIFILKELKICFFTKNFNFIFDQNKLDFIENL
jgi:hypothetical protein